MMTCGRAMRRAWLGGAAVAVVLFCGGCESTPRTAERPSDQPQKPTPQSVLKQVPAHTIGLIHIDAEAIRPFLTRTAEEMKKTAGQQKTVDMLEAAAVLAQKVTWLDVYVVALKDQPPLPLFYFQTDLTADQFADLLAKVLAGWTDLLPLDRTPREEYILLGPGKKPGVAITDTAAFSQIRNGVVVSPVRLADVSAIIQTLGAGASKELAALGEEVNADAPVWTALLPSAIDPSGPLKGLGQGYFEPSKESALRLVFNKTQQAEQFEQSTARMGLVKVSRSDQEVNLTAELNAPFLQKLLAWLEAARRQAIRTTSAAHLRAIGVAVAAYQAENYDKSPPDLKTLVEKHLIQASILASPASERRIQTDAKGLPIDPSDYVYFELPAKADAALVRAYEPPELSAGQGGNVLLADGSVHWMTADELETAVKKSKESLKK